MLETNSTSSLELSKKASDVLTVLGMATQCVPSVEYSQLPPVSSTPTTAAPELDGVASIRSATVIGVLVVSAAIEAKLFTLVSVGGTFTTSTVLSSLAVLTGAKLSDTAIPNFVVCELPGVLAVEANVIASKSACAWAMGISVNV